MKQMSAGVGNPEKADETRSLASLALISGIAVVLLVIQVWTFYWGFEALDDPDPSTGLSTFLAWFGLTSSLGFTLVLAASVRRDWLRMFPTIGSFVVGSLIGLPLAGRLEAELSGFLMDTLGTWVLLYMLPWAGVTLLVVGLVVLLGSVRDVQSRDVIAVPFILLAGCHLTLHVALLLQGDDIAEAARGIRRAVGGVLASGLWVGP